MEGESEGVGNGAQEAEDGDEQGGSHGGGVQAVSLPVDEPDEDDGGGEHHQQDEGVAEEGDEQADDVRIAERPFLKQEEFDEDPDEEHRDDGEDQPAEVLLPRGLRIGLGRPEGPGEKVQPPADHLRGEEGRQAPAEHLRREVEELGPEASEDEAHDVHEDDTYGGEFHRQAALQADEDGHQHGQERQDE